MHSLERTLQSCGKKTFVDYIEYFLKGVPENKIHDMIRDEYSNSNSAATKFSCVKRIYEEKASKKALENILSSDRVPYETKEKAQKIIEQYLR